ncbi:MAG TPA: DMT family transporter [Planctomycetota bacterium]|nr:DMT family transporter [Planctomycetota bacterium]
MGRAYVSISIVTLLWAINFKVGKIGTGEIDPLFIASFRIIVTGLFFYSLLKPEDRKFRRTDWRDCWPLALTGIGLNHICFAVGISRTIPSHSAVIHALIPGFVALAAWIVLREAMAPMQILGILVALAGTLTVVLGVPRSEFHGTIWGDLITMGGITAFSIYTVFGRRVMSEMGSRRAVTLAFLFAAPFMIPLLVIGILRVDWAHVTWRGWSALAYMLLFANMVAYLLHSYALSRLKAGQVAAFTNLQPAIAIAISAASGDPTRPSLFVGAAIALAGVVLVQLRRPPPSLECGDGLGRGHRASGHAVDAP